MESIVRGFEARLHTGGADDEGGGCVACAGGACAERGESCVSERARDGERETSCKQARGGGTEREKEGMVRRFEAHSRTDDADDERVGCARVASGHVLS